MTFSISDLSISSAMMFTIFKFQRVHNLVSSNDRILISLFYDYIYRRKLEEGFNVEFAMVKLSTYSTLSAKKIVCIINEYTTVFQEFR